MRLYITIITALFVLVTLPREASAQTEATVRLKDLVTVSGNSPMPLTGYGIVVGLDRTGDRARGQRGSPYTVQSIANMLERFGITVNPDMLAARNTAAVMVTATLDPYSGPGSAVDVTIASLGDAKSLSGGVLLQTPLVDVRTNAVYAMAQGSISTGAVLASASGSSVRVNHSNTGRIPGGGIVTQGANPTAMQADSLGLLLRRPDFTNASRIADAINAALPGSATVRHAGLISLTRPASIASTPELLATVEPLSVTVDVPARVVINERTGTIVSGGNVRISEVMVTYGSVIISTQVDPFVSQPGAFSQGETVAGTVGTPEVSEEGTRSVVLDPTTDVNDLAAALNNLGLTARDVIAIFQTIDRAGALQGELVII